MAIDKEWIPVFQSAIVALSTIGAVAVGQVWTSRRDRQAKALEIEHQRANQRNDFQRKTLLRLQSAMMRHARAVNKAQHQTVMAYRRTGTWGQLVGEEVSEELGAASRVLAVLRERVQDDEIRAMVKQAMGSASAGLCAKTEEAAKRTLIQFSGEFEAVSERLGKALRKLL